MKELSKEELSKRKYAFPEERKYPMPDKAHVLSAIKFFNYVDADKEGTLAKEILKRIKEYGIKNINVGKDNRFIKYYKPKDEDKEMDNNLSHSAKGHRWSQHKYIDIKNGRYIYTKKDLDKATEKYKAEQAKRRNNIKELTDKRNNEIMQISLIKNRVIDTNKGLMTDKEYERYIKKIRDKYDPAIESNKEASRAASVNQLKNIYKYQNSFNYKSSKAIENAIAKGKAFINKLFNKQKKTKRTTEEALLLNTKLRAKDRVIKRKGLAKYGKM